MTEILIPREATVIIIGVTSAGKTTLSERLVREFSDNGVLVSYDDVAVERIRAGKVTYTEESRGWIQSNREAAETGRAFQIHISEAVRSHRFVAVEFICTVPAMLLATWRTISFAAPQRPIVLIKLDTPAELQMKFCQERPEEMNISLAAIEQQRRRYQCMLRQSFAGLVNLTEYVVTDPRKVNIIQDPR